MARPKVQKLSEIMKGLDSAFAPQRKLIKGQIAQVPEMFAGQRTELEQARDAAFRNIDLGAESRGLSASGIPLRGRQEFNRQSFAPGLQKLEAAKGEQMFALQSALQQIVQQQRERAEGLRESQLTRRSDFDVAMAKLRQEQQQFREKMALEAFKAANRGGGSRAPSTAAQRASDKQSAYRAARLFREEAFNKYGSGDAIPKGFREEVLRKIVTDFGGSLNKDEAKSIIYEQFFPDGWEWSGQQKPQGLQFGNPLTSFK